MIKTKIASSNTEKDANTIAFHVASEFTKPCEVVCKENAHGTYYEVYIDANLEAAQQLRWLVKFFVRGMLATNVIIGFCRT